MGPLRQVVGDEEDGVAEAAGVGDASDLGGLDRVIHTTTARS